jgi:hypothetical protein
MVSSFEFLELRSIDDVDMTEPFSSEVSCRDMLQDTLSGHPEL